MSLLRLYARNMRQVPRIPTVLVFGIMMPVIQLLLFGSIFSATTELPGFWCNYITNPPAGCAMMTGDDLGVELSYQAYIAPAIILLTCFFGMANASAALIVDLRTGYFDKLRTTPTSPLQIIVARLMAEMTRVAGQATLILLLALGLGAKVATGLIGAIVIVILAVFFSACTVGLLVTALAMKTKSDQATQSAFPLFFILIFLSTAYMPKSLLPGWLQTAVQYNPIDYLINALRALMLQSNWPVEEIAVTLGASVVLGALLGILNWRVYSRMVG